MYETGQNEVYFLTEKEVFVLENSETNAIHLKEKPIFQLKPDRQIQYQAVELWAVAVTVLLKFILMDWLGMRAFYIAGTCIFWFAYVIFRYRQDHTILKFWGFKRENFAKSMYILLPLFAATGVITLIYGMYSGIYLLNIHIIPVFLLYPAWGIIQQFMLVCIIAQNIHNTVYFSLRKARVILFVSVLFSLVHYPYPVLMIFTLLMEIIFLVVFYRWRSLWAIGLMHGWIATLLLYYVLQRDLWLELFAWF